MSLLTADTLKAGLIAKQMMPASTIPPFLNHFRGSGRRREGGLEGTLFPSLLASAPPAASAVLQSQRRPFEPRRVRLARPLPEHAARSDRIRPRVRLERP